MTDGPPAATFSASEIEAARKLFAGPVTFLLGAAGLDQLPKPDIPVAEDFVGRILSIPAHENMTMEQAEYVARNVREFYGA